MRCPGRAPGRHSGPPDEQPSPRLAPTVSPILGSTFEEEKETTENAGDAAISGIPASYVSGISSAHAPMVDCSRWRKTCTSCPLFLHLHCSLVLPCHPWHTEQTSRTSIKWESSSAPERSPMAP